MTFPLAGEGFAFGAAICWAIGPLVAYRGIDALGTFRFSQLRYCISAVILFVLAAGFGSLNLPDSRAVFFLIASGVVGVAFGEAVLFQAVYFLGPRIASIVFSLHAPITAILGAAIFSEAISLWSFIGIVMAITGVCTAIVSRSNTEKKGGEWHKSGKFNKGIFLAASAVVFQVVGALLAKGVMQDVNPFFASFLRTGSAAVAFLPIFLMLREYDRRFHLKDLRLVLYSAAISTVGGMTLLLAAFAYTEIFRAVIISSSAPVLYILIMSVVRRERFPLGAWLGTVIAIAGVALTIGNI